MVSVVIGIDSVVRACTSLYDVVSISFVSRGR